MPKIITLLPCGSEKFQESVDQVSEGGILLLEPGIFELDQTIFLPSNIKLIGAGRDQTKISLAKNSSCHFFTNKDHTAGNHSIEICHLSMDGNLEHQPKPKDLKGITFACGFYFKKVKNVIANDLLISNIRQTGLHFNNSENVTIRDYVCDTAGWSGVSTTKSDAVDVEANITNSGLDIRHSGVHFDGGKNIRFIGSVTNTTGNGVMLDSKNHDFSHAIVNAHVSNCYRGVSLSGYYKHQLHTIYITGAFTFNKSAGAMISNSSNVIVNEASFIRNQEFGLLCQGRSGGRNCLVSDCYFDSNGEDISEIHASSGIHYFNNQFALGGKPSIANEISESK